MAPHSVRAGNKNASAGLTGGAKVLSIISLLPDLTNNELRLVLNEIEKKLLDDVGIDRNLFDLVFEVTGEKPISIIKFANSSNGVLWRKNIESFNNLAERLIVEYKFRYGHHPKRTEILAIDKFLMRMLIDDIKERGIPVTLKMICQEIGFMRSVIDRSFPRYLDSGLGQVIISQIVGDRSNVTR